MLLSAPHITHKHKAKFMHGQPHQLLCVVIYSQLSAYPAIWEMQLLKDHWSTYGGHEKPEKQTTVKAAWVTYSTKATCLNYCSYNWLMCTAISCDGEKCSLLLCA